MAMNPVSMVKQKALREKMAALGITVPPANPAIAPPARASSR